MVSERDRIEKIVDYLNSQGVFVNISKNKARGHKGFFKFGNNSLYRIDIAKGLTGFEILKTLVHEFAHFIHFKNSNDLNFLDFIFPEFDEKIENELLEITVNAIPKDFASSIYEQKNILEKEKFELLNIIKSKNPKFKISDVRFYPEPLSYLLKYDRVVYNGKILSIENLEKTYKNLSNEDVAFFKLKSYQRK